MERFDLGGLGVWNILSCGRWDVLTWSVSVFDFHQMELIGFRMF